MQFRDSFDDEPDPLTQLALSDIQEAGFLPLFEELGPKISSTISGLTPNMTGPELRDWLINNFPDLPQNEDREEQSDTSTIAYFRRVTLCTVHWPGHSQWCASWRAHYRLDEVMEGVKRSLNIINAGSTLPLAQVAERLGVKDWSSTFGDVDFLKSAWMHYHKRSGRDNYARQLYVLAYFCQENPIISGWPFHSIIILLRCFLWKLSEILTREAKILVACSDALEECMPPDKEAPKASLGAKIFTSIFIPNMLLWRCTFSVVKDVAGSVTDLEPRYILPAICLLLRHSRHLCVHHFLHGNFIQYNLNLTPACFFQKSIFADATRDRAWLASYRSHLESIIRSEGNAIRESREIHRVGLVEGAW
jgi:hypothetical protein